VTRTRELRREDISEVADLVEFAFRSGSRTAAPGLAGYLERLLFEHPWVDPDIPSLVSVDDGGRVIGCLGSHVRRFRFDGRPIRVAVSGQLVVDPSARRHATGAFLMKRYLEGHQDATFTDTASATVQRMWQGFGGEVMHLGRIGWLRLFAPFRFTSAFGLSNKSRWSRQVTGILSAPLDALASTIGGRFLGAPRPEVRTESLRPDTLVQSLTRVAPSARLYPDYDESYLRWLFAELAALRSRGTLAGALLRDRSGAVLGWHVYYLRRHGVSQVLQIVANERSVGDVVDHLFHHARVHGSAALQGRLEPHVVESLARRNCILHASGYRVLVHASDPELARAFQGSAALISRLDGDWWTGISSESFDRDSSRSAPK
jgi:GNAT superfamily N-acetyltransferase